MPEHLINDLRTGLDYITTCLDYAILLDYAHAKTGWDISKLRERFGEATYAQWARFLNIT